MASLPYITPSVAGIAGLVATQIASFASHNVAVEIENRVPPPVVIFAAAAAEAVEIRSLFPHLEILLSFYVHKACK